MKERLKAVYFERKWPFLAFSVLACVLTWLTASGASWGAFRG
jgi:uncharacterized protein involved in exopolysaccharide biosynthesis